MKKLFVLWIVVCGCVSGCYSADRHQECYALAETSASARQNEPNLQEICPSLDLFAVFPQLSSVEASEKSAPMAEAMDFTQDVVPAVKAVAPSKTAKFTGESTGNVPSDADCIDINNADESQLRRLPGVGPARAQTIIATRHKRPFKRKSDLARVKGIGPKSVKKMSDLICDF